MSANILTFYIMALKWLTTGLQCLSIRLYIVVYVIDWRYSEHMIREHLRHTQYSDDWLQFVWFVDLGKRSQKKTKTQCLSKQNWCEILAIFAYLVFKSLYLNRFKGFIKWIPKKAMNLNKVCIQFAKLILYLIRWFLTFRSLNKCLLNLENYRIRITKIVSADQDAWPS